ncbi:hypothetical protein PM082_018366 [Marasmius tenuissimus]|nr:hypothetical protein PM082_018366 [Marasmius tenuissimus]
MTTSAQQYLEEHLSLEPVSPSNSTEKTTSDSKRSSQNAGIKSEKIKTTENPVKPVDYCQRVAELELEQRNERIIFITGKRNEL